MIFPSLNIRRVFRSLIVLIIGIVALSACQGLGQQQARVDDAQRAAPVSSKQNFLERRQISLIEDVTDQPGQLYFVYFVLPTGTVFDEITCVGRPTSSTESMEPNEIYDVYDGDSSLNEYGFRVPLEGGQVAYSPEAMGRDGTYGDPVPFRQCITTTNAYVDFPAASGAITPLVYDEPRTFSNGQAQIDRALVAKQLQAQQAILAGKCVDNDLNITECSRELSISNNPADDPQPTAIPLDENGNPVEQPASPQEQSPGSPIAP